MELDIADFIEIKQVTDIYEKFIGGLISYENMIEHIDYAMLDAGNEFLMHDMADMMLDDDFETE